MTTRADPGERWTMAGLALAAAALLLVSAWLRPDPGPAGTHTQLGLPPCGFHALLGLPCPSCGMTTAFALAVRARLGEATAVQPFGTLLCAATAAGGLVCVAAAAAGLPLLSWVHRHIPGRVAIAALLACWIAAWGWTIAQHPADHGCAAWRRAPARGAAP